MEIEIVKAVQKLSSAFLDMFFSFISKWGEFVPFLVIFVLMYWCFNEKSAMKYLFVFLAGIGVNTVLKKIIRRPRPYVADSQIIDKYGSKGYSMPSGHTTSAVLTFGGAYYLTNKKQKKWQKIVGIVLTILIVLLVMFSRIYLGQHYLSDTIVAVIVSLLCLFFTSKIFDLAKNREHQVMFLVVPLSILFLAFFGNPFVINSALEIYYIGAGAIAGVFFGYYIDKTCVKREISSSFKMNLLQIVVGAVLLVLGYFLIELIPDVLFISYLKYFAYGVLLTLGCSALFKFMNGKIAGKKQGAK